MVFLSSPLFINRQVLVTLLIPPADADGTGGLLSFVIALLVIAAVCVVLGEIATLFGCAVGLSTYMTGLSIVALGTSVPDTAASMIAARTASTADSAIGNITGSNACNVFLGLGLSFLISSSYCAVRGRVGFLTHPGFICIRS